MGFQRKRLSHVMALRSGHKPSGVAVSAMVKDDRTSEGGVQAKRGAVRKGDCLVEATR